MIKLGSHAPFKSPNYFIDSAKFSIENNANAMMIFLGAPQNTRRVSVDKMKVSEFIDKYSNEIPFSNILVHGPYIINPSNPEKNAFAIEFIIKEMKMMEEIGLEYYVIHPGARLKNDLTLALDTCVKTIKGALKKTKKTKILIETMSGKGSEVGYTFEQLKYIIENVDDDRVGICLDTCHLFASGIDFMNYESFIKELKKYKLLSKIWAIHINDSKMEFGSRKDRHANLGKGFIPLQAIKKLVHGKEFQNAIKVLETPWVEGKSIYKDELKLLKK